MISVAGRYQAGLEIIAGHRSIIGKKLFMIGGKTLFSNRKSWESHVSGKHCFQSGKAGKVKSCL
jgi:hypothetical protein